MGVERQSPVFSRWWDQNPVFINERIRTRFIFPSGSGSGHFVPATLHFQAVVLEFARAKSGLQDYNVFARHNSN